MVFNILVTVRGGGYLYDIRSSIFIVISVFYFTNWAEYFTGYLNTAKNGFGVIEVILMMASMYFITGIYGT